MYHLPPRPGPLPHLLPLLPLLPPSPLLLFPQVARRTAGMKPTELRGVPKRILLAAGAAKPRDEHELAGLLHWFEVGGGGDGDRRGGEEGSCM